MQLIKAEEKHVKPLKKGSVVWVVSMSYRSEPDESFCELYSSYEKARKRFISLMPDKEEYEESEMARCDLEEHSLDDSRYGMIPYERFINSDIYNTFRGYGVNNYDDEIEQIYCLYLDKQEVDEREINRRGERFNELS